MYMDWRTNFGSSVHANRIVLTSGRTFRLYNHLESDPSAGLWPATIAGADNQLNFSLSQFDDTNRGSIKKPGCAVPANFVWQYLRYRATDVAKSDSSHAIP